MHEAYLDLLKRTVTNFTALGGDDAFENFNSLKYIDPATRTWAIEHLARPMTLLRRSQLDLIERLVRDLERRAVPGDYIEAGVWRGAAIIFMRALIEALQIPDRVVVAADSFAGIPKTRFSSTIPSTTGPSVGMLHKRKSKQILRGLACWMIGSSFYLGYLILHCRVWRAGPLRLSAWTPMPTIPSWPR